MKVAFLLKDLQLSGGVNVVVEHARRLAADHGIETVLVRTGTSAVPDWPYPGLDALRVATLAEVAGERFDVAVATWWETAMALFDVAADRHAYFVQLLEDSHYPEGAPDRSAFLLTLALPVRFITEAAWIADMLAGHQPGNPPLFVPNGIAKEAFTGPPPTPHDGPLRVVIEGNLHLVRKGVPHALHAVAAMREAAHVTLVTGDTPTEALPQVDRHLSALSHAELAALFRESDVLVKLTRAEGMYGPPLEGFHCGATVVTTAVTGHDMYVEHGVNGLVVDWDDPDGSARALDLLARDRALLQRLREGAYATAQRWPSWDAAAGGMAEALRTIAAEPPPSLQVAGARLAADIGAVLSEGERAYLAETGARLELEDLREQRAIKAALAARRYATPALSRVKRVARRVAATRGPGRR